MPEHPSVVWFRNDLRVEDHAPLQAALGQGGSILAVYCFDPRQFQSTPLGFPRTGALRAKFLRESVNGLADKLALLGNRLVVTCGKPEIEVAALAKAVQAHCVYFHREVTTEELAVEQGLLNTLRDSGIASQGFWGATLYHPNDLPMAIANLPAVFTQFRKAVEKKQIPVRDPLPAPSHLLPSPALSYPLVTPPPAWFPDINADPRRVMDFFGGETGGQQRLNDYFWRGDHLQRYKETRNGMLGADYSSKLSPWLALGCLSPRWIYQEVQRYEAERVRNDSTYWLIFELLWRDFFRFVAQQYGDRLFYRSGLRGLLLPWREDTTRFEQWQQGQTGYPLVDANMRELKLTGFMSNRGRQNVASFLCKNLGIDWRWGAQWFESCLVDYDVCSNWGNWNYTAGVGNDARGFRYFNIPKQSQQYDPQGDYLRHWLPELTALPGDKIHQPWRLSQGEQQQYGVRLGLDYPRPCVDFFKSIKSNQRSYPE